MEDAEKIHVTDSGIYISLDAIRPDTDETAVLVVPTFYDIGKVIEFESGKFSVLRAILSSVDSYGLYELTETEDEDGFLLAVHIIGLFTG